jgi:UDP-galactopyranose mutase
MKTDFLIVGCGFYGAVIAERIARVLKKEVIIIDKRDHIGGNCFSEIDKKTNIEYHKYGTHIFHTGNQLVWDYINKFTKFNNYRHQVLSLHDKKIYQMPINLETINSLYKKNLNPLEARKLVDLEAKKFQNYKIKNFENRAKSQIGNKLYNAFIKGYTLKQWGKSPKLLPESIFNRLPIRFNYNEDYFSQLQYQGIPLKGYTEIFKNLLDHKKIKVLLNKKYDLDNKIKPRCATIYTGPLDSLFKFKFGKLEWRSLKFKKEYYNLEDYQGSAVINYPDLSNKFTRIHEPKHLHPEREVYSKNKTFIIKEFSINDNENPYYPINDIKNRETHRKYKKIANNIKSFYIGGRLADYAYYDMDMTISAALKKFNLIKNK